MLRGDHLCPFMKKTCIGCSVYRGRHSGLWSGEGSDHGSPVPARSGGSGWAASLDSFFKDVAVLQGRTVDCD